MGSVSAPDRDVKFERRRLEVALRLDGRRDDIFAQFAVRCIPQQPNKDGDGLRAGPETALHLKLDGDVWIRMCV